MLMSSFNKLLWTRHPDNSQSAIHLGKKFVVKLEPRPIDRWVVLVNDDQCKELESGGPLLLWYQHEAKEHAEALASGNTGYATNTYKKDASDVQGSTDIKRDLTVRCYPPKDLVVAAVKSVTLPKGRSWSVVDEAKTVLTSRSTLPDFNEFATLQNYVVEIAKWGSIYRWLSQADIQGCVLALWDVRQQLLSIAPKYYTEHLVNSQSLSLFTSLSERMRSNGVSKSHWSLASKLLHWLLPTVMPVYDSIVLVQLNINSSGPTAYRSIIEWEYECAKTLEPYRIEILCGIKDMTLLAAIDNFLWLSGKN